MTILVRMESNIFGKLLTKNIMLGILGGQPNPKTPYQPRPLYGGAEGGLNKGADLMSLTPKFDMFLESL